MKTLNELKNDNKMSEAEKNEAFAQLNIRLFEDSFTIDALPYTLMSEMDLKGNFIDGNIEPQKWVVIRALQLINKTK
tara:strand:- start:196 stop:426 length:231 start_codon:yes stop_codon:yes gene_type:complete